MNIKQDIPSLSKLYKSEYVRKTVWTILTEDFEDSFERLMKECKQTGSHLEELAKINKCHLQQLVIEYGYEFETLENLKLCLDTLKEWNKMFAIDSEIKRLLTSPLLNKNYL